MLEGTLANRTGEQLLVYGPKRDGESTDNSLYVLPPNRKTPSSWDCDGFFVPNDRIADQLILPDRRGPVAVKYVDPQSPTVTKSAANKYSCAGNYSLFAPGDVNWPIPNLAFSTLPAGFPDVPGHLSC